VTHGRRAPIFALGVTCALAGGRPLDAQLAVTLDGGASRVHYDGFLPTFAASLTPTLRLDRGAATLLVRGSLLRFESGHQSWQGLVAGAWLTPRLGRLRGEVAATLDASRYLDLPTYRHVLVEPRVHWTSGRTGAWVGGGAGRTSFGGSASDVRTFTGGVWLERRIAAVAVSATVSRVGDTSFTDFETRAHGTTRGVELDGRLGARVWSRGGGRGVYGEATAAVPLPGWSRASLVLSGGRYPSDPVRGSIPGRYIGAAVRLTGIPGARGPRAAALDPSLAYAPHSSGTASGEGVGEAALELRAAGGLRRLVRIYAPGVALVEVAGDFTDWVPVALPSASSGVWERTFPVAPGIHRIAVRVDGGDWRAPRGTTRTPDDFGGEVGVLVVPGF
jgi:hypothetical protein